MLIMIPGPLLRVPGPPRAGAQLPRIPSRFGIRFFMELDKALGEMQRVLKPGARASSLAGGCARLCWPQGVANPLLVSSSFRVAAQPLLVSSDEMLSPRYCSAASQPALT